MIPAAALVAAIAVLAGALVLLVVAIATARTVRHGAERRRARVVAALRPQVAAVVSEALDTPDPPDAGAHPAPGGPDRPAATPGADQLSRLASRLPRRHRAILDEIVLGYLSKVRGLARAPLLDLLQRNGTVPRARRRLGRPGLVGRAHAAEILGRAGGPEAVGDLIRLLSDRQPEVRVVAAGALAAAPPRADVVRALLATIDSDRRVPAGLVADTLVRLGPDATPPLAEALTAGTPNVRAVAAETLGLLDSTQATQALLAALDDPAGPAEVGVRAAGALGRIGAPAAFEPLVACLRGDRDPALLVAAVAALGLLGRPGAVPHLLPMLAAAHAPAAAAALALTRLGPAGIAALEDLTTREPDSTAAGHAAAALAIFRLAVDHAGHRIPVPTG